MVDKRTGLVKLIDFGSARDFRNENSEEDAYFKMVKGKRARRRSFVNYVGTIPFGKNIPV